MQWLYNVLAYPFGWALSGLYHLIPNYLISLIILTVILRLLLLPSSIKQQKSSANQMRLTAKVNKIKRKYAGQNTREAQQKQQQEIQELYSREGFGGLGAGCAPMVLQLVVMTGLYGAIYQPLSFIVQLAKDEIAALAELAKPIVEAAGGTFNASRPDLDILQHLTQIRANAAALETPSAALANLDFDRLQAFKDGFQVFGIDLSLSPAGNWQTNKVLILIPIFAALTALLSAVYTFIRQRKTNPEMGKNPTMGCMLLLSPAMSGFFSYRLSAGIGFYWIISNILSFIQMIAMNIFYKPSDLVAAQMIDETVQRRAREKSIKDTKALLEANKDSGRK